MGLRRFEEGFRDLNAIFATMGLMIDGDGSSADHFGYIKDKFGFDDNAGAKAGYEELASCLEKLNTDSSVSSVNAAILQVLNKFR